MIDLNTIIAAITAISGTGAVGALYKVFTDRSKRVDEKLAAMRIEHDNCAKALFASNTELVDLRLRVLVLEMKNDIGFPMWKKTQEGRYLWANPEFARRVLAPLKLNVQAIYGKRDDEILEFAPFVSLLLKLDDEAAVRGYAIATDVTFNPQLKMTIIKRSATDELGGITLVGIGCPQN